MVLQEANLNLLKKDLVLPTEGIKIQAPNTRAFIGETEYGKGVLCVAESNLIWKLENNSGLCFEYPNIALHAVSTDLNAFPHECLYIILDKNILEEDQNEEDSSENDEKDESENITAIRFVPEDKALLNQLFVAMNDCQALYPDESMSGDEEDGEEDEEGEECEEEVHGDEDVQEYDERNFFDAETDPNDIELSVRDGNNGNNMDIPREQYEDADDK